MSSSGEESNPDIANIDLDDFDDDDITLPDLFQTFFAGENNKNIVDTLESVKDSIDSLAKIMDRIAKSLEMRCKNSE